MAKDPVCGMETSGKGDKVKYNGKTYYFCSPTCKWAFETSPKQFVKK